MISRVGYWTAWAGVGLGCSPQVPAGAPENGPPRAEAVEAGRSVPAPPAEPGAPRVPAVGRASCARAVLDDLEDGDDVIASVDRRGGPWYTYADDQGSSIKAGDKELPAGELLPVEGGASQSKYAVHVSARLASAKHSSTYVGVGMNLTNPIAPYDLTAATGVCFSVKGEGFVRFQVTDVNTAPEGARCKECNNHFGENLPLSPEWEEHCVKFSELSQIYGWGERQPALSADGAFALQWLVMVPEEPCDLWLDNVRLSCE